MSALFYSRTLTFKNALEKELKKVCAPSLEDEQNMRDVMDRIKTGIIIFDTGFTRIDFANK